MKQYKPLVKDGENRAVRDFLLLYAQGPTYTVGQMKELMDDLGWDDFFPKVWPTLQLTTTITKEVAQIWIRYLFSREEGKQVAWMIKTGHGTHFSETKPDSIIDWKPLYDRDCNCPTTPEDVAIVCPS